MNPLTALIICLDFAWARECKEGEAFGIWFKLPTADFYWVVDGAIDPRQEYKQILLTLMFQSNEL